jgi:peptidoglycan lytic transglycosylase
MLLTLLMAPLLAACATNHGGLHRKAFTSREFGVSVSPRVTTAKYPPRGGGRYMDTTPYVVRGVTYKPVAGPGYVATGEASWYGMDFHGRRTANGEIFGAYYLTMASPVLPIPSYARVTNLENGRSVLVRVNDRGPYMSGRIADLSYETAQVLGFANAGSAQVQVAYVGPAPLQGDDNRMLMASLNTGTPMEQGNTRIALADVHAPSVRASGPHDRNPFSGGLIGKLISSLSYADDPTETDVNAAVEAATAMATRAPALDDWKQAVDDDARKIRLELGTFSDAGQESSIVTQFAMLGAVDEDPVQIAGKSATRLTLTHLKPGVARADVLQLAQKLGLTGIVLY